jgi:RNA polymerase sigma-70 factor (ECF subfamily)
MTDPQRRGDEGVDVPAPSDATRFQSLYDQHFRVVWSVVGQLGLHGAAREDAAQEVWLVAYRRLHTLQPHASARAWLCAIARKVVWRHRRTLHRFDRRVRAWAVEAAQPGPDTAGRYEAAATVHTLLESLSEAQRSVLVLTMVHGFSAPEVAEALDVPVNTVYSRLRLARRRIAEDAVRREALEAELAARDQPPADLQRRVLSAVLPGVALPVVGTVATLKAFALGGVLGGALVGAAVGVVPTPPVREAPARPRHAAQTSAPAVSPERAPPPPVVAARPEPVPVQSAVAESVVSSPSPRRPVPVAVVEPTGATSDEATLDLEATLLARAQRAVREGRHDAALRMLRQHELQFAEGKLADVREGAMVRALCGLGRDAKAAQRVAALRRSRPDSPVATAVGEVCARDRDGSKPTRR